MRIYEHQFHVPLGERFHLFAATEPQQMFLKTPTDLFADALLFNRDRLRW